MLSDWLLNTTALTCKISAYFGAGPLHFDPKSLRFTVIPKSYEKLHRNFCLSLAWLTAAIPIILIRYKLGDWEKVNLSLGYLFAVSIFVTVFSISWGQTRTLTKILNALVYFINHLREKYMDPDFNPNKNSANLFLEGLILVVTSVYALLFIQLSLFVIADPQSTIHLGKLIPSEYFYFPIRFLVTAFHVYLYLVICVNNYATAFASTSYGFYMTLLFTHELRLGKPPHFYHTLEKLRSKPYNLQLTYRSFQVLHHNTMRFIGYYLLAFYAAFTIAAVYVNFVLIHYWGVMHLITKALLLIVSIVIMGSWTSLLELGKLYFVNGSKLLNSWKGRKWGSNLDTRVMNRFRQSCKPILISYGKLFVIRRPTILIYFRGVVRGTFRALLTMR